MLASLRRSKVEQSSAGSNGAEMSRDSQSKGQRARPIIFGFGFLFDHKEKETVVVVA